MTVVVSDTSPLNYLILIGSVRVLPELFTSVVIPQAVLQELQHERTPQPVAAWVTSLPDWVEVRRAGRTDDTLALGAGEKEALALAQELGGVPLLMDERKGCKVAQRLGLITAGTLNVLEEAAVAGLLDIEEALDELKRTSFRASADLFETVRRRVKARKA